MKLLLKLAVFVCLIDGGFAVAASKQSKITRSNLSQFKELGERFTCFKKERLGVLDRTPLKVGRLWESADPMTLNRTLSSSKKALARAQNSKRKNNSLIRSLQKKISTTKKLLSRSVLYASVCPETPKGEEFIGAAELLSPYKDTLTDSEVRHLLNKVAFGGNPELFTLGKTKGLNALVDELLNRPLSDQVKRDEMFWASRQLGTDEETGNKLWHTFPLQFLAMYEALFSDSPLQTRMAMLFWHPHFAINLSRTGFGFNNAEHTGIKEYWERLEKHSLGNFKTLAEEMITDKAMMRWLNNEDNAVGAPNQNFAREFLELFTLGQTDPITGQANYGEDSVVAGTAFLSGYTQNYDSGTREIVFYSSLKDPSPYSVFQGISGAQANQSFTAKGFVNHVLMMHPGSSRFLAERLFAQLAYPDVEETAVAYLAKQLVDQNYELKPVLKIILKSQAMFSTKARKRCISNPIDQVIHLARKLIRTPLSQASAKIEAGDWLLWLLNDISTKNGQTLFEPPSVFAWRGACGLNRDTKRHFGEGFITEQNVLGRSQLVVDLTNYALAQEEIDFKSYLPANSSTPRALIKALAEEFYNFTPSETSTAILERYLTLQPDEEGYESYPFNISNAEYVRRKIPGLIVLLGELTEANQL
jgi:hypothetical protein